MSLSLASFKESLLLDNPKGDFINLPDAYSSTYLTKISGLYKLLTEMLFCERNNTELYKYTRLLKGPNNGA